MQEALISSSADFSSRLTDETMTRRRVVAIATAIVIASLAVTAVAAEVEPAVAVVADLLGCSAADRDRLEQGEVVSVRPADSAWDEAAAVIVHASPSAVLEAMKRADFFHVDRRVFVIRDISRGPIDAATFAPLPIDTAALVDPAVGAVSAEWNLSATERALLRDVERDGEGDRGLSAAFRHILAERTAAYRSGGTRAIASYVRPGAGDVFAAGAAAAALWARYARLDALAPGFHAAVATYPRPASANLRHSFFASVVALDQRPATVLSHRVESSVADYAVAAEREFYVSRVYGVRQTIVGAAAVSGERAVAFYLTSVAGAASSGRPPTARDASTTVSALLAQLRTLGARAR
jgi:hypothetical protein